MGGYWSLRGRKEEKGVDSEQVYGNSAFQIGRNMKWETGGRKKEMRSRPTYSPNDSCRYSERLGE